MLLSTARIVAAGLLVAVFATGGSAAPVPAGRAKAEKELAALSAKLHGAWLGAQACEGRLTLHTNGTYEWAYRGPGGETDTGAWGLHGDPAAPTLVLKCTASDDPKREGKTVAAKLVQLEPRSFELEPAGPETPRKFARAKCGVR